MNIEQAGKALDSFFQDEKQKVLLLKGPWGGGKSHLVRKYLASDNSYAPRIQYFVSRRIERHARNAGEFARDLVGLSAKLLRPRILLRPGKGGPKGRQKRKPYTRQSISSS